MAARLEEARLVCGRYRRHLVNPVTLLADLEEFIHDHHPRPFDRRRHPAASLEWLRAHRVLGKGSGDIPAPPFLDARLVGEFELGDSVHALDNLMDRVDRTEDSVHPLT